MRARMTDHSPSAAMTASPRSCQIAAAAARRDGDAVVMGDEIFHPHAEPQGDIEVLGDG